MKQLFVVLMIGLLALAAWGARQDALELAIEKGWTAVASATLALGAELDRQELDGTTPLMHAASAGDHAMVALLLAKGADRELRDGEKHDAAWHAKKAGHDPVALQLKAPPAEAAPLPSLDDMASEERQEARDQWRRDMSDLQRDRAQAYEDPSEQLRDPEAHRRNREDWSDRQREANEALGAAEERSRPSGGNR